MSRNVTHRGILQSTMQAVTITANANHATVERLFGFSVRESAGTAAVATVNFRKAAVGGQIIFTLELAANESAAIVFPRPLGAEGGVYVEVVAGTISGTLFQP